MTREEAQDLLRYVMRHLQAVRGARFQAMQGRVPTEAERGKWLGLALAAAEVDDLYRDVDRVLAELAEQSR